MPASVSTRRRRTSAVGPALLGRVIDAFGQPLDGKAASAICRPKPRRSTRAPPPPFTRRPDPPSRSRRGVRAIDALLPLGRGQRIGLFAGTGVGKSTLLGMMCRHAQADVIVVGLVGERGREVGDFVRNALGEKGLARSVVVAATSDMPPLVRARGALRATAIAEHFRAQGKSVLLVMDSVTRYAMALREASLAAGEPPLTKGYTPTVFAALPMLLERAGNDDGPGSITAVYTVLVEGDDLNDPIADAVRGILDGHVVLSRKLADRGLFPAIDVSKQHPASHQHDIAEALQHVEAGSKRPRAGSRRTRTPRRPHSNRRVRRRGATRASTPRAAMPKIEALDPPEATARWSSREDVQPGRSRRSRAANEPGDL